MSRQKSTKNKWFIAILVVLLVVFLIAFGREYVGNIQVQHYIEDLQEQKLEQESEQLETMALIQELSSEYFLESEGRIKQGLGQEGETVIVIQNNGNSDGQDKDEVDDGMTNVARWFYYFFASNTFNELKEYEDS